MAIALGLVLAASFAAAVTDVRTRRVPNAIVISLFLCGLLLNAVHGWRFVGLDLIITAAVILIGTVAFSMKLIGGGDVKLLAAAAGTLGYPLGVRFLLLTLLCGGLVAIAYSATRGKLRVTFLNLRTMALPLVAGVAPARPASGTVMPYAVAIFTGALCTALLTNYVPHLRLLP